jgi:4'-phosphopantetheinyl transferase
MTPPAQGEHLGKRDVHIWLADPQTAMESAGVAARFKSLLDPDESKRLDGFRFDRDRQIFLCAHALLRTALSRCAPIAPGSWIFIKNAHGRPEISGPPDARPLRFNLSHTTGLVACAITRQGDIGLDVEDLSRGPVTLDVAERFFAPREFDLVSRAQGRRRHELFYTIWTLKEAYIKARGLGLSLALDSFCFELGDPAAEEIEFDAEPGEASTSWRFHVERIGSRHMLALAVRMPDAVAPLIRRAGDAFWQGESSGA